MTKRAAGKFKRRNRDFYPTPEAAVLPLLPHLLRNSVKTFAEPCAGDRSLIHHLEKRGLSCVAYGDLATGRDAREWTEEDFAKADVVVTNPPWDRPIMHAIMEHQSKFVPSWFLVEWDWLATKQSRHLHEYRLTDVVPIGRVKWIPGSASVGFDNCCWVKMSRFKTYGEPVRLWSA